MSLDLGTLNIKIGVSDQGVSSKLDTTKKKLDDVKASADKVGDTRIGIDADASKVDKAKDSTTRLGSELDTVGRKRVSPTVDSGSIRSASEDLKTLGSNLGGIADKVVKFSAGAAAVAGIGTIGTALTKGFSRLDALDQASAKLEALGNNGVTVQQVMDNALASVKGTAFGIGDAASTAAVLVGAGVEPGQELERTLGLVADSAAIAGVSFGEMGSIWGKVASSTVLSGEEMAQISDRSIGLQVALAEQMGVTALEAKKAVSEGKVSFEDFEQAMESLVGGGAVRMGETVSGAMDNFGAALGRGGAAILDAGFEALPDLLGAATSAVDDITAAVTPLAAEWGAKLAPHLENFASELGPNVAVGMSMISDGAGVLAPLIGKIGDGLGAIPWPVAAGGITALIGHNKGLTDSLERGTGRGKEYVQMLTDGVGGALARAGGAYDRGSSKLGAMAAAHRNAAENARLQGDTAGRMGRSIDAATTQAAAGLSGMARGGASLAKSAMDGVTGAAKGVMGVFGGPWGLAIMGATTLLGYLATEHYNAKRAEEEHESTQRALAGTLDETTGAITRQTEELVRNQLTEAGVMDAANELALSRDVITQAALGNEDAMNRVAVAAEKSNNEFVQSTEWWGKYGSAVRDAGYNLGDVSALMDARQRGDTLTDDMVGLARAIDDIPRAHSDMFGLQHEFEGAQESVLGLTNEVIKSSGAVAEVTFEQANEQLLNFEDQVKQTTDVIKLLGDAQITLESDKFISVEATPEMLEAKEILDEMNGITTSVMEGRMSIQFDDGYVVSDMLDAIGVKLTQTPEGHLSLNTTDLEEAQSMADALGAQVQTLPDGTLALDYKEIPEAMALMETLGILVKDGADGELRINDSAILDSDSRMQQLATQVAKGAQGVVTVSDNVDAVMERIRRLNGMSTQSYHTVVSNNQTSTNGRTDMGRQVINADGNIWQFANGSENHVAQIARPGDWRVWAEPETGGEAYIPLAPSKRGRSTNILEEVARRFGKTLIDQNAVSAFADGGISDRVKGDLGYMNGTPYIFGGWSPSGVDCSGAVALVVNAATGRDPWEARTSTHTMDSFLAERGFMAGQGGPGTITVGWKNGGPGGGHTALTLPDGTNIESGGNTGGGFTIGGRAASGSDPQFTDFMHLPLGDQEGWSNFGGLPSADSYTTAGGGGSRGGGRSSFGGGGGSRGGGGLTKTINGGSGALVEDGSLLELVAALYSAHTGMPMADDVVSWGNVMGLGTTFEGEDLPGMQRDLEREARDLRRNATNIDRNEAATLRDIEQAKADLKKAQDELAAGGKETGSGKNKKWESWSSEERAERERKIADQQDKLLDLQDKLIDIEDSRIDLADSQKELIESQNLLREAVEKAAAREEAFGGRITPMASGGILGGLNRNAQISEGQSAVLWAEDGPEAYIPLSSDKRAASTDIWLETGKRLGIDVAGMLNFLVSGASGLVRGDIGAFSTGGSVSLSGMGINSAAASHMGQSAVNNAVGAAFYGPVQINDPQKWAESHLDTAQKMIHSAMKGMRNG